ncbi:unnamed protein product [Rhodiola kirilowii]
MATLQKFKLFATQCAAVNISTQSPTTSPLILRRRTRRKTLRMLLTRRPQISDFDDSLKPPSTTSHQKRLKLKDLFFSSSPTSHAHLRVDHDRDREESSGIGPVQVCRKIGPVAVRPVRFRNRLLLRKSWRPVLSTIEEVQD